MTSRKPLAITTGEPSGIGPEISIRAALEHQKPIVLIGDQVLLKETADRLNIAWPLPDYIQIKSVPLAQPAIPGHLNVNNASYVLETLSEAHHGVLSGKYSAIVTAPVQKSIINDAGLPFSGHTEFFQQLSNVPRVVMMLTSSSNNDALRVALVTTHLPIAKLSQNITAQRLDEVISILFKALIEDFGLAKPRVAITGLNPHAGENGYLGHEEIDTIIPAIERAQHQGLSIEGPFPADTIFVKSHYSAYDAVLAMFHDQGLPVLKHVGFGQGVNVTLGLPYIRTSVDHGTALDIAGKNKAEIGSMLSAIHLAHFLANNREHRKA